MMLEDPIAQRALAIFHQNRRHFGDRWNRAQGAQTYQSRDRQEQGAELDLAE